MVEEDAIAGIDAIGFAVVNRDPVGVHLGHGVRAARVKGGGFLLGGFLHQTIQLGGGGLVETGLFFQTKDTNGFQNTQRADTVGIGGVFGLLKTHRNVALGGQVVDFVRLHLLDDTDQAGGIGQIPMMQNELAIRFMGILIQVVNPVGIEKRRAALDAMDFIAFFKQQFGQIGPVLSRYTRNQRYLVACFQNTLSYIKTIRSPLQLKSGVRDHITKNQALLPLLYE